MTDALPERLQASLGGAYRIERELGGGGMSRVFVADEVALGRKVVVKVLPPDLAAGVSVDRFKREILVSARLQHPHIVPVLAVGESDGLPYYTMPFVDGSSLRARLARGGLSITETVSILRDVARALAYAHGNGVVHRDIKPDNVLLTGGSAVVTDFGIAKALSASRSPGGTMATITQIGTSIGTPAYMSPEQSAGDPATDHRTDLYSFGVMGYEMLAGRTPFHGLPPHKMLAAQMGETPQPILELRPDTPPPLADLIMRCLAKDASARPQHAADVAALLETVTSGTGHTGMPSVLLGGRVPLAKALAIYAAAFIAVAVLARAAIVGIGLPDWVFPGTLVVMTLGLPVVLFTYFVHRQAYRALTMTPTLTPGGGTAAQGTIATIAMKASPHVSWRRTTMGGVYAVGAFIVLIGGWMLLRALGIGPSASLMAAGKLGARERVILAEFKGPATDSLLGQTVTEAFRTALGQSASLTVMPASNVREVLRRMQQPTTARVDYALAREIATREGIKAVVDGEVVSLGGSYVLSTRLVNASTGDELAALSENASGDKDLIPAIGRLAKQLRERIGESLRKVQNARTLDKVSTPSLQALQKYVQALQKLDDGDWNRARALFEESVAIDTGFAMAYRKLAIEMANRGVPNAQVQAMMQKAYDHRERLSDAERYITMGSYFKYGPHPDAAQVTSAYESLLEIDPENVTGLNNLAVEYERRQEYAKAIELTKKAISIQGTSAVYYNNAAWSAMALGNLKDAEATLALAEKNIPKSPSIALLRAQLTYDRGQYDSALAIVDSVRKSHADDASLQAGLLGYAASDAQRRGKLSDATRLRQQAVAAELLRGSKSAGLSAGVDDAIDKAWFLNDREAAKRILAQALAAHPLESIDPADRPFVQLAGAYALVEQADGASAMLSAFDKRRAQVGLIDDDTQRHELLGWVAMAQKQYAGAAGEFRAAIDGTCLRCELPYMARAYDLAGNADSARVVLQRFVSQHEGFEAGPDSHELAPAHKRLGELAEAKGDNAGALQHYQVFVELWKNADAELQPAVAEVRARIAKLQKSEKR